MFSLRYAKLYCAFSMAFALAAIAMPAIVYATGLGAGLFGQILVAFYPPWFVVSLVSIAAFRRAGLSLAAPASYLALIGALFLASVYIEAAPAAGWLRQFWLPGAIWLFMFFYFRLNYEAWQEIKKELGKSAGR